MAKGQAEPLFDGESRLSPWSMTFKKLGDSIRMPMAAIVDAAGINILSGRISPAPSQHDARDVYPGDQALSP